MHTEKSSHLLNTTCGLMLATTVTAFGQISEPTEVERGPHSRIWQTVQQVESEEGVTLVTNRFEELQTGLHRWTEQGWVLTDPKIELFRDGAILQNLQYQVIFAQNLASPGAIDILLADGQNRLTGHILGLAYVEGDRSAMIAEVQDCVGEVGGPEQNEVIYRNAFTDFEIDVKFVATRSFFSQELLLQQQIASPLEYGLTENAVLTLLTEFTTFPQITKEARPGLEMPPGQPLITDERISLGSMEFDGGKAFTLNGDKTFPVAKSFEQLEQRWFLLEKISWQQIRPELEKLPIQEAKNRNGKPAGFKQARKGLPLPAKRQAKATQPIRMAQARIGPERGFLWDYTLVTTTNDFRFKRDTTYYVSGNFTISGSNVMEGGVVIKYAPTNTAQLNITGTIYCDSSAYAPIVLTARDDHTVGENIGSASLSGYYATNALRIGDYSSDLKYLRISYAQKAIVYENDAVNPHTLTHAQLVHCREGIVPDKTMYHLRNVLMYDVLTNFHAGATSSSTGRCEHLTINLASTLNYTNNSTNSLLLTNCLLVAITNSGAGNLTNDSSGVGTDTTSANVFQTVGGSSHYLLNNTYRDLGTTNINASLLVDLKTMTTYPPLVLTNSVTVDTTLGPQAQRDTDTPDYGYHLSPLDWVASGTVLTNATLLLTNDVALATYGSSASYGILIKSGGKLVSEGTASALNRIVRYNMVQEQATTNWSSSTVGSAVYVNGTAGNPEGHFRFTAWSVPGGLGDHFSAPVGGFGSISTPFSFEHCQFGGGQIYLERPPSAMTNCLFERVALDLDDANKEPARYLFNNLFRGGSLNLYPNDYETWLVKDNFFDQTAITGDPNLESSHGYNGYVTNQNRLTPNGTGDVVLTNSPVFLTSTLGKYYYATADGMLSLLIDVGSRKATNAGLYHFTTTTNKEAASQVDIGFHYVAVTNGVPIDTDSDSIPDYLEDRNGNGSVNSGETDWNSGSDFGLKVRITEPKSNSNLP